MKIGLGIIACSMLLVVAEGFASYYWSNNFFPSQVMARWGKAGIAFFAHGGMWGDLLILPVLFAFIITKYGASWTPKQIVIMAVIGVAVTAGNHLHLIFNQTIPDPIGWQGEKWSTVIALHFVYMGMYVALAGLFYFSPGVSVKAAVAVSAVLGIHIALGTHAPLGLLNRWYQWEWCPNFPSDPKLQVGIWTLLSILATVAAGWRAGLSVAAIGSSLIGLMMFIIKVSPVR